MTSIQPWLSAVTALVSGAIAFAVVWGSLRKTVEQLRQEVTELREANAGVRELVVAVAGLKAQFDGSREHIERLEREVGVLVAEVSKLKEHRIGTNLRLRRLEEEMGKTPLPHNPEE